MNSGAPVHFIDPLTDPRWGRLVESHPRASIFHSTGWLEALRRTYAYEPVAVTTSQPGEDLRDSLVFCRVRSWLTGRRMVSLPFSDHCEPLVNGPDDLRLLLSALDPELAAGKWGYAELRPASAAWADGREVSQRFVWHTLDLRPSVDSLLSSCHKDCVQRKIRRAEREGIEIVDGRSDALLEQFYQLLLLTRRRHRLPPQPLAWFRNLLTTLGDRLTIRVALKDKLPVAAIMTASFGDTLTYKYGCSDRQFSSSGATQLLLWAAIVAAKNAGLRTFDLGRSDIDNPGLIEFKDRWGARRSELLYLCYPGPRRRRTTEVRWVRVARQLASFVPDPLVAIAGKHLYRHFS